MTGSAAEPLGDTEVLGGGTPALGDGFTHGREGRVHPRRVATRALGQVGLAAAARPERRREHGGQLAGAQAGGLAGRVDRGDEVLDPVDVGHGDDHPGSVAQAGPHLGGQAAQVTAADPVGSGDRGQQGAVDVFGRGGELTGAGQDLARPDPFQLLLGRPQPGDEGGDPVGQFLRAGLQGVAELVDQRPFRGQEAQRLDPDVGLQTTHAGADRGLPQHA